MSESREPPVLPTTKIGADPSLEAVRALAQLMDTAFVVPGTKIRFGLDSLIGLIPGIGDLIGLAIGMYIVSTAARLGVPNAVIGRMLLNVGIDAAAGAVPVVGDVFDMAWKANVKNAALLERAVAEPAAARRASWGVFVGIGAAAFVFLAAAVAAGVWLAKLIAG